jgi:hypothetical protein
MATIRRAVTAFAYGGIGYTVTVRIHRGVCQAYVRQDRKDVATLTSGDRKEDILSASMRLGKAGRPTTLMLSRHANGVIASVMASDGFYAQAELNWSVRNVRTFG